MFFVVENLRFGNKLPYIMDIEFWKKHKKMFETFESNNSMIIDIPKKSNREVWKEASNTIESACRKL